MSLKQKLTTFVLVGMVPLVSVGLIACNSRNTSPNDLSSSEPPASESAENSPSPSDHSDMAQMDHGSLAGVDLGPADDTLDLRFIDAMIPHHEGAVLTAQEALQKSNRPEVKQLAQAIIDAQESEIAMLKEWRTSWYPDASPDPVMYSAEMGHTMPMPPEVRSSMMMTEGLGSADEELDLRFLNMMIFHHEKAIEMAQQAIEKSNRDPVKELAQTVIESQQAEVDQMQQWRKDWYGQ